MNTHPIISYYLLVVVLIAVILYIIWTGIQQRKFKAKYQKLLSQKKSSEVMIGLITEQLAPFLNGFDYTPEDLQFLGNPIDYIHFDRKTGTVTFIEVKSGNSQLSKIQRLIRNAINENRVYFTMFRVPSQTKK